MSVSSEIGVATEETLMSLQHDQSPRRRNERLKFLLRGAGIFGSYLAVAVFLLMAISPHLFGEMEFKRTAPGKESILRDIDDDYFRQVFAAANLESSEDMGFMDNAIVSRWCGISEKAVTSLVERQLFTRSDNEAYNRLRLSGQPQFDEYAIHSTGQREFGLGLNHGSDCVELLIMN